jgi:predicted ABC-type transport system involved in lysophospholipase L1 biosynthesis ATPase subunit
MTVILITHDPDIARECPRVLRMEDGRVFSD